MLELNVIPCTDNDIPTLGETAIGCIDFIKFTEAFTTITINQKAFLLLFENLKKYNGKIIIKYMNTIHDNMRFVVYYSEEIAKTVRVVSDIAVIFYIDEDNKVKFSSLDRTTFFNCMVVDLTPYGKNSSCFKMRLGMIEDDKEVQKC